MRFFFDLDGTLAKWQPQANYDDLYKKGYFANLPAEKRLVDIVNKMCASGNDVYVLSAYLADSLYAKEEKHRWIKKHLSEKIKTILVPCGESKSNAVKVATGLPVQLEDFLVDDHSPNCIDWKNAGGTSIKFLNEVNGKGVKWNGLRKSLGSLEELLKEV